MKNHISIRYFRNLIACTVVNCILKSLQKKKKSDKILEVWFYLLLSFHIKIYVALKGASEILVGITSEVLDKGCYDIKLVYIMCTGSTKI